MLKKSTTQPVDDLQAKLSQMGKKANAGGQKKQEGTERKTMTAGDAKIARLMETEVKPIGKNEISSVIASLAKSKEERTDYDLRLIL